MSEPGTDVAVGNGQPTPSWQSVNVPLEGTLATLDQAMRYAHVLAQADILPDRLRGKSSNTLAIILYGQQLNVPPVVAVNTISVVNGRPMIEGKLLLSKLREAGHSYKRVESTTTRCVVEITRGDTGEVFTEEFTWDDAKIAQLTGKDNYKKYPKKMLFWRAVAGGIDLACPEVKMGFGLQGVDDDYDEPPKPTLAQVAAERMDQQRANEASTPEQSKEDQQTALQAELAQLADEHSNGASDTVAKADEPPPPPDYVCDVCGATGAHYQDECPDLAHPAEEVGR
ncbi:hypothetical protein [Actinocrispum wychmicini]|uniref:RecT family protein n=1 Tax=Actinocrispum wychmicini TaxID=1213861 RepID=A0A4R2JF42_9PSEU|nr:hypothetical protein [Actinocrispum wychmicini]TCO57187.1 hypothetical protein EV192_106664 [Actinocrispum wychmicini]